MIDRTSLANWMFSEEMVLADLSENAKNLFAKLCQFECGCLILHFLHSHATTLSTADDIAYHLSKPIEDIERDLNMLARLDLAQTTRVADVTFYCLTTDPAQQKLAHELCAWQDRWEKRVRDIMFLVWGNNSPITYMVPPRTREVPALFPASPVQNHAPVLQLILEGGKHG
jgi:hypothetical protein